MTRVALDLAVRHAAAASKAAALAVLAFLFDVRAELATAAAIIVGWALITKALVALLARWAPADPLWSLSFGLFLLSLSGWSFLRTLFGKGLYALTHAAPARRKRDAD